MLMSTRMIGFGAGLLGLGYGVYRLRRGRRDWMTTAALSAGASLALSGMVSRRGSMRAKGIRSLVSTINRQVPGIRRRVMRWMPTALANGAQAALNALQ